MNFPHTMLPDMSTPAYTSSIFFRPMTEYLRPERVKELSKVMYIVVNFAVKT